MEHIPTPRGAIWAADVFSKLLDTIDGGIDFIVDQFNEPAGLEQARSAEDVIRYANSIRHQDPSFADELIAAANRSID